MTYRLIDAAALRMPAMPAEARLPYRSALALEPRIALDAAAAVAAFDAFEQTTQAQSLMTPPALPVESVGEGLAADAGQAPRGTEIAFIDGALSAQTKADIRAALRPGVEYVELSTAADGVSQIHNALEGRSGVSALHIISEGSAGRFQLGSSVIDQAGLADHLGNGLARWAEALNDDADILIYGCDVGAAGPALADQIANLTGADVAISIDKTGAQDRGGDWELELASGEINTAIALTPSGTAGLDVLLAAPTVDIASASDNGREILLSGTYDPTAEGLRVTFGGNTFFGPGQVALVNGQWFFAYTLETSLAPGSYDVVVTVTDGLGVPLTDGPITDLTSLELVVPGVDPNVLTLDLAEASADGSLVTLGGSYDANAAGLRVTLDGVEYTSADDPITMNAGSWELILTGLDLAAGSYSVLVEMLDAEGQPVLDGAVAVAVTGTLSVDALPLPAAPTVGTATAAADGSSAFLSGTYDASSPALIVAFANQSYSSTVAGQVILNPGAGTWQLAAQGLSLQPGTSYEVTVSVASIDGVVLSDGAAPITDLTSLELVVPGVDPNVLTLDLAQASADGSLVTLGGSYDANAAGLRVTLDGVVYTSADDPITMNAGSWELILTGLDLAAGSYSVLVEMLDAEGQPVLDGAVAVAVTGTLSVDALPLPAAPTVGTATAAADGSSAFLSGTYDASSPALIVAFANQSYSSTVAGQVILNPGAGTWQLAAQGLSLQPGTSYEVTVSVASIDGVVLTDGLGNQLTDVTRNELVLAPINDQLDAPVITDASASEDGAFIVISGRYDVDSSGIVVELGGVQYGVDDVLLDSVTGTWQLLVVNAGLLQGTYPVTVWALDAQGNQTLGQGSQVVVERDPPVVDTTPPEAPVLALGDDIGLFLGLSEGGIEPVESGGYSNDDLPLLRGMAEAGSLVSVYVNDHLIGEAWADDNGHWSLQFPEDGEYQLAGGASYTFTARCEDAAGNVSEFSEPFVVVIDTAGPVADAEHVLTNETKPVISGTVVDVPEGEAVRNGGLFSGIYRLDVEILGEASLIQRFDDVEFDDIGNWSIDSADFDAALAEGSYDLRLVSIDRAGNVSEDIVSNAVIIDLTPPPAPGLKLIDSVGIFIRDVQASSEEIGDSGVTNDPAPTLGGYSEPGSVLFISLDGDEIGMAMADAHGAWSFSLAENEIQLDDGAHYEFSVLAQDIAGNLSCDAATLHVSVDLEAPEASADPVTYCVTCERSPTISGYVSDPGKDFVSGVRTLAIEVIDAEGGTVYSEEEVSFDKKGNWSVELKDADLADGSYSVRLTVMDQAGNLVTQCVNDVLLIDTVPPEQPVISAIYDETGIFLGETVSDAREIVSSGSYSNEAELRLEGRAEADSVVEVYLDGEWIGEADADADGYWSFALADAEDDIELQDGTTYEFTVVARDEACNSSEASEAYALTMDFSPPEVRLGCLVTHDNTPVITGWIRDVVEGDEAVSGSGIYGLDVEILDAEGRMWFSSAAVVDELTGQWTLEIPEGLYESGLPDGEYDIRVAATDMAGNVSHACFEESLKIDSVGVVLNIDTVIGTDTGAVPQVNSGDTTNDNTLLISGTASDGLFFELSGMVMVYEGDTLIGEAELLEQSEGKYTWSLLTGPLADGPHSFYAVIREVAECEACEGFAGDGKDEQDRGDERDEKYAKHDGDDSDHDSDRHHADGDRYGQGKHGDDDREDSYVKNDHGDKKDRDGDDCKEEYVFVRNVPSSVINVTIDTVLPPPPLPPFVPYNPPAPTTMTEQAAPVFSPAVDTVAAAVNGEEFTEYVSDIAPDTVLAATNNTDFSQYISNQAPEIVRIASTNSNPGGGTNPPTNFVNQDPATEEPVPTDEELAANAPQEGGVQNQNEGQPQQQEQQQGVPQQQEQAAPPQQQEQAPPQEQQANYRRKGEFAEPVLAATVNIQQAPFESLPGSAGQVQAWQPFEAQVASMLQKFEQDSRELELLA